MHGIIATAPQRDKCEFGEFHMVSTAVTISSANLISSYGIVGWCPVIIGVLVMPVRQMIPLGVTVKITLYDDATLFEDCCNDWCELLANSDADEIFLTCEWQATWWEAYHPGDLWILVIEDEESGQWHGVAPWFIGHDEDGRRVVRTIGCVDVTDYLDIIVRRGHEETVYRALLGRLVEHANLYDEVHLCNVPEQSATLRRLPELAPEYHLRAETSVLDVCPIVRLPDSFAEYIAQLDKKNRHEVRRKLRRAAEASDWYVVGPEHDLAEELEHFMALMAASTSEKAEFLADPANRRFFELIVPKMADRGWLYLAFLTANGSRIAGYLNFEYNNRVLVYNSGHDPNDYGHLSPGIVLLARLIEHAIERGRTEFDFLRGNEAYKYDMGGQDTTVHQVRLLPVSGGA